MAAVSESMSFASQFLAVTTPTYACSPRGPATPQSSSLGWGSAVSQHDVKPSTALSQGTVPTTLSCNKRSLSTLSLGGGDDSEFLEQPLTRFMSEDFMSVFNNPVAITAAANEATSAVWNGLNGIVEEASAPGSPTNVDFNMEPADVLTRQKSQDLRSFALNRDMSEDLSNLLLNRQRSMSGTFSFYPKMIVDSVPTCPPPSIESQTGSAAAHPCSPHQEESGAMEASNARDLSSSSSDDEAVQTPQQDPPRYSTRNAGKPKRQIIDSDYESDEEYTPSRKSTAKKARKMSSSHTKSSKPSGYAHNNRGAHVRGRPEMQETARNGQRHWASEVQNLRQSWQDAKCAEANPAFQAQLDLMARRHIKNQHECLLRSLHVAVAEGMIEPHAFTNAEGKSFLGWTGFDIVPDMASEFRAKIESMFPQPLLENTLHNTFRRAGLVPVSWSEAWLGLTSFHYKKPV